MGRLVGTRYGLTFFTFRAKRGQQPNVPPSQACQAGAAAAAGFCIAPTLIGLFTLTRGLVPARWHSDVTGPGGRDLSIDVQVNGLDTAAGDYIARCLRQVFQVETVLTSQKHLVQKHLVQKRCG